MEMAPLKCASFHQIQTEAMPKRRKRPAISRLTAFLYQPNSGDFCPIILAALS
jgi:hypothetical protein